MEQDEINALLVELGGAGRRVVRLKGGDPFVFGRGGEEAQALAAAGIPFEVVPAVTAGVAAPAYAGIPVTHRDDASAVALVTGHEDPAKDESALDWPALARVPGHARPVHGHQEPAADRRAARSPAAGRRASPPPWSSAARCLASARSPGRSPTSPAGRRRGRPAARHHARRARSRACTTSWPGSSGGRCFGRTVVVTRARAQASALAGRLGSLGAAVVEAPAIRIEPRPAPEVDGRLAQVGEYALVCLTSPNGAMLLMDSLERNGGDARSLAGVTVAAIGPGTAAELRRRGVSADVVPERSIAEALVEALGARRGGRPARAGGTRGGGARRAAGRAGGARRGRRRAAALRDGGRAGGERPLPGPTT